MPNFIFGRFGDHDNRQVIFGDPAGDIAERLHIQDDPVKGFTDITNFIFAQPDRIFGFFIQVTNQVAILGVEIRKDLAPVPPVQADFGQLRQAFINIVINAIEAMGKGGILQVTTRPLPGEGAVEIVFQDDGPGIPPELMVKIFDPFFTTKEKGTGLGLSVVYGIVDRHKGHVSVDSDPGKGTRFTIRLPAARGS